MKNIPSGISRYTLAFLIYSIFSVSAIAGTLKGRVEEGNKKPVEGATVAVRSGEFETMASTDASGNFSIAGLADGNYEVSVIHLGVIQTQNVSISGADDVQTLAIQVEASKAKATVYDITATGTLIGATTKDTAIPIYGVDRETNEKRGDPSVLDQIKSMPIGGPVFGDNNPFNADAQFRPGAGTINIRGLGARRTLVLLNGKRFSANNLTPPDTNLLPTAVIGRSEVLKDGAAATYGSDALAGVANFFTRQDIDGFEFNTDYRYVADSIGDITASGAYGHQWDGGNFLMSLGYQYRGELYATDRAFTTLPYSVNPGGYSPFNNPGTWAILGLQSAGPPPVLPTIGLGLESQSCAGMGGTVAYVPAAVPGGYLPLCYYSFMPNYNLVEEQHGVQIYSEFNSKIGSTSKLHIEGLYSLKDVPSIAINGTFPTINGPTGPGTSYFVPATNPHFAQFLTDVGFVNLTPFTPYGAASILWNPFGMGGNPYGGPRGERRGHSKNELIRVSGELAGETGILETNYRLSATYLVETQAAGFPDMLTWKLHAALNGLGGPYCTTNTPGLNGCEWLNPFASGVPGSAGFGVANPNFKPNREVSERLARWLDDENREFKTRTDLAAFEAVIDGEMPLSMPGGKPQWALGAQFRRTTSSLSVDNPLFNAEVTPCPDPQSKSCTMKTGPYIFSSGYVPYDVGQNVLAFYGQLDLPAFDSFKTSFGLRYEDYGSKIGNTANPQLRSKWQVFDFFALRGSIGTAFRGPAASDVAEGIQVTQLSPITAAGRSFRAVDIYGNPNLKPESAFTFNVGGIFQVENFTSTIDYWFYKIDDQIERAPADRIGTAVLDGNTPFIKCSSPLVTSGLVTFDNNNSCVQGTTTGRNISRIRSDMVNGPSITTTGIDLDANYVFNDVFGGSLALGGVASIIINYEQEDFMLNTIKIQPAFDAVGFTNYDRLPGTIARWRGDFYVNYNNGWHNVRVSTNYADSVTDNRGPTTVFLQPGVPTVTDFGMTQGGFVTLDVVYQLSLPWDMKLTLSGLNLIGMDPPGAATTFGYDPFIGNPLGRMFKFGINQKF